ncbi:hypothetical protein RHMOL_Rhmol05G0173700 [Rhododendron molle]|uniref:Uncharacterized protein n=1 Tax=Rhododendron molle TaxID=49168 RepID=A0ACC0NR87_RHOML|nr:hypothetical protein RHMOL_Rhmol05G0173700 [Rhododendron molle]
MVVKFGGRTVAEREGRSKRPRRVTLATESELERTQRPVGLAGGDLEEVGGHGGVGLAGDEDKAIGEDGQRYLSALLVHFLDLHTLERSKRFALATFCMWASCCLFGDVAILETQYLNVQAIVRVTDFGLNFYYLACSICKKATNAYGGEDFWCNYCNQKVAALTK